MNQASPMIWNCARRLVTYETRENQFSESQVPVAFRSFEKLRFHLITFMGSNGFRTLMARACALATEEAPWLQAVRVKADGKLEGLEECHKQHRPDDLLHGGVVLLAKLLGLLVAFIGDDLTFRIVREVWPQVPLNNLDFERDSKNEYAEK